MHNLAWLAHFPFPFQFFFFLFCVPKAPELFPQTGVSFSQDKVSVAGSKSCLRFSFCFSLFFIHFKMAGYWDFCGEGTLPDVCPCVRQTLHFFYNLSQPIWSFMPNLFHKETLDPLVEYLTFHFIWNPDPSFFVDSFIFFLCSAAFSCLFNASTFARHFILEKDSLTLHLLSFLSPSDCLSFKAMAVAVVCVCVKKAWHLSSSVQFILWLFFGAVLNGLRIV